MGHWLLLLLTYNHEIEVETVADALTKPLIWEMIEADIVGNQGGISTGVRLEWGRTGVHHLVV